MESVLKREDIERASRREGFSHPVVSVLEYHEPKIVQLNGEYASVSGNHEQQVYIARNFGFLGDALEGAGDFSLGPLDLVAIWSKAVEIWPHNSYPRYKLSAMLGSSYGIIGRPDLKGLSRYYVETSCLLSKLVSDKSGLLHIQDRLHHIYKSLDELDFYVYGTKESPMRQAAELIKKRMAGDEEAGREFDRLVADEEGFQTPLLDQIDDNSGDGMAPFDMCVQIAIKGTE